MPSGHNIFLIGSSTLSKIIQFGWSLSLNPIISILSVAKIKENLISSCHFLGQTSKEFALHMCVQPVILDCEWKSWDVLFFSEEKEGNVFFGNCLKDLFAQWTIYSATTFLESCRKVVREKWFEKSGSRNLVREKWLTRKKGGFIL